MDFCTGCGHAYGADDRFCEMCGQARATSAAEAESLVAVGAVAAGSVAEQGASASATASEPVALPGPSANGASHGVGEQPAWALPPGAEHLRDLPPPGVAPVPSRGGRRIGITLGVAILIMVTVAVALVVARPGKARVSTLTERLAALPSAEPQERWAFDLGDAAVQGLATGPGVALALTADEEDMRLVGVDIGSGDERWSVDVDGAGSDSSLEVVGDRVVVSRTSFSGDDVETTVQAFTLGSGEHLWEVDVDGGVTGLVPVGEDAVIVNTYDGDRSEVALLEARTGEERWLVDGDDYFVMDDTLAVSDGDRLTTHDVGTGEKRWSAEVGEESFAIGGSGDALYTSDGRKVTAWALGNGNERWSTSVGVGDVYSIYGLDDTHVLVNGEDGTVVLDDRGTELWSDNDSRFGLPVDVGGTLALIEDDGEDITVTDAVTERRLGDLELDDGMWLFGGEDGPSLGVPVASNGLLITDGGDLTAYALPRLEEMWSISPPGDSVAGVDISSEVVLVVSYEDEDVTLAAYR